MKGRTKEPNLSHKRVLEALDYDPESGRFLWRISPAKNVKAGSVAGGKNGGNGYRYIRLDGYEVTESRLAWFYMKGSWPERRVRFINGDKTDCRFANLTLFNGIGGEYDYRTQEGRIAYLRAYRKASPDQEKARALRASFGLSLEKYKSMFASQNGKCAICGQPEKHRHNGQIKALAVDHNHKTGAIRGLLCSDCNTGIGKLREDPKILQSAIRYLLGTPVTSTGQADAAQTM